MNPSEYPEPEPVEEFYDTPEDEFEEEAEEMPKGISPSEVGVQEPKRIVIENEVINVEGKSPQEIIELIGQKAVEYGYANFIAVKDGIDIITTHQQLLDVVQSGDFRVLRIVRNEKAG